MLTREQAIAAAGARLAQAYADLDSREPREAATAAWVPGGASVDELEQRVRDARTPVQPPR